MLLSSVIIILREILEAAMLTSLLLAFSFKLGVSRRWLILALCLGLLGSAGYAALFDRISQGFDGLGQEITNGSLQLCIFLSLLLVDGLILLPKLSALLRSMLKSFMICGVVFAITREGSEIYLYLSGFISMPEILPSIMIGGVLGSGIGLSIGVFIYYLFIVLPTPFSLRLGYGLLIFIAAGIVNQAVRLFIQIDWLPAQPILWDTSAWVSESSVTGQLLYVLIGYEATPTPIELQCYGIAVISILLSTVIIRYLVLRNGD